MLGDFISGADEAGACALVVGGGGGGFGFGRPEISYCPRGMLSVYCVSLLVEDGFIAEWVCAAGSLYICCSITTETNTMMWMLVTAISCTGGASDVADSRGIGCSPYQ